MGNHYSDPICDTQGRIGWMLEGTGILGEEGNYGYYCTVCNGLGTFPY